MTNVIQLESLTLAELTILLGHLRLGVAHLKKRLNKRQYDNLLKLGSLSFEQKANVSSNRAEKSGNIALVLNTVITSVFGAWMGFSGFMSLHLNSFFILGGISSIAVIVGVAVSYFSFKLTEQTANGAVYNQMLYNLQLHVLSLIIDKQKDDLSSAVNYVNHSLNYVKSWTLDSTKSTDADPTDSLNFLFENSEEYQQWAQQLSQAIQLKVDIIEKSTLYSFYSERILKILDQVCGLIMPNHATTDELSQSTYAQGSLPDDDSSFIKILSIPHSSVTDAPAHKSWLQQNLLSLIAGIIPTLLGGFASMFVFLAGGPNLAKELGLSAVEQVLRYPSSRAVEFSIALSLTIYYGMSFVYNNYKMYVRQHEVVKTKEQLILAEKENADLTKKLNFLIKMKRHMMRLINIFTAVEKINDHKHTAEKITAVTDI